MRQNSYLIIYQRMKSFFNIKSLRNYSKISSFVTLNNLYLAQHSTAQHLANKVAVVLLYIKQAYS